MPAVREPARLCELRDVVESVGEATFADPEVHLAHAGVVDDDAAARKEDELASRGRVSPCAVCSDLSGCEARVVADQCIDEGGLPDARWTEQHASDALGEHSAHAIEPEPRPRRNDADGNLSTDVVELGCDGGRVVLEIRLRQHHDRARATLDGECEVAFEEPAVELLAERLDHEHDVDVRSDHLLARDA